MLPDKKPLVQEAISLMEAFGGPMPKLTKSMAEDMGLSDRSVEVKSGSMVAFWANRHPKASKTSSRWVSKASPAWTMPL